MEIGLVGAGEIAHVHAGAVRLLQQEGSDVRIVASYDSGGASVPTVQPVESLRELLDLALDAVIIATPSHTHLAMFNSVRELSPHIRIWMEKPAVAAPRDKGGLHQIVADPQVVTMYHAAYAPEVQWAADLLTGSRLQGRSVEHVHSFFADPYSLDRTRLSHDSSWIDSGINGLSVLHRLFTVSSLRAVRSHDELLGTTVTLSLSGGATALLSTQWRVAGPSKNTVAHLGGGALLFLDHQASAGRLVDDGVITASFGVDSEPSRLHRHYQAQFRHLIANKSLFTVSDELLLHDILLSVPPP